MSSTVRRIKFPGALDDDDEDLEISRRHPLVEAELRRMRTREAARRLFEQENRGPLPPFDAGTLAEILGRPAAPPFRAGGLIPPQASTLITAQRKTGKTMLITNLARCLLTGEDFLGRFPVEPVDGMVALLNFEVSAGQLAWWASEVGVPRDRFYLVNLRGRRNPLTDREDRAVLAADLRNRAVESLMVDPFGRAYTGASENDAGEVGRWLTRLDHWARGEVGAVDVILTCHAGWNAERTRGSTALEDWADTIITLTRDNHDDTAGDRYFRAVGRDVDVDEDRLIFEKETRRLSLAGAGSRKLANRERRASDLSAAVLRIATDHPGVSGGQIERELRAAGIKFQKGEERQALAALAGAGQLLVEHGARNAKCYWISSVSPASPTFPAGQLGEPPQPPSIGGGSQRVTRTGRASPAEVVS
jgi:hypothetical protein